MRLIYTRSDDKWPSKEVHIKEYTNHMVKGSSPPQVETFSVSKTFTRTPRPMSKMNAVARAKLTFQTLILLKKTHIIQKFQALQLIVLVAFGAVD